MASKDQVIDELQRNPNQTTRQLADKLNCSPQYITATCRRLGLKCQPAQYITPEGLRKQAAGLIKKAEELEREEQERRDNIGKL